MQSKVILRYSKEGFSKSNPTLKQPLTQREVQCFSPIVYILGGGYF